ncbi:hypothetical protein [Anditalea andensis]|uniref:Uncharacterized protein n=1 Tax=Anditalea andensis TaxID=1048983 RepID=A0A074LKZ3_9BACT|nr:hypothetical protein [Anditalea andensis]KEO74512.1 hypothetical protein EL17_07180 [Anditalea andensis]
MKFFILCVISSITALLLGPLIPYWGLMIIIGLAAALVGGNRMTAFLGAGLGMALIWFAVPLWISIRTGSALPMRISAIMGFQDPVILMVLTSTIGFLIGGVSAWTGNSFRKIFTDNNLPY